MTTTSLNRWSCIQKELPNVENISEVNIFDFDNTLFYSPVPNRNIWDGSSLGMLQNQETFYAGGWWHYTPLLSSLGQGLEIEESKAWQGWWNEELVELVRGSIQDKSALTILLTGRKQQIFSELLIRMMKAKNLDFDMVVLKPLICPDGITRPGTKDYKQKFFEDVMLTYNNADELNIYEDRIGQVKSFEAFLSDLNSSYKLQDKHGGKRSPFKSNVIAVPQETSHLNPEVEIEVVTRMINENNNAVINGTASQSNQLYTCQKTRLYTGYLIAPEDSNRLSKIHKFPDNTDPEQCRLLGDNIMISFRPPSNETILRAGGFEAKRQWRVNGLGNYQQGIWAARLTPVDPSLPTYTDHYPPAVILAHKRGVKTSDVNRINTWEDISEDDERAIIINSVASDKSLLRITLDDENNINNNNDGNRFGNKREYNNYKFNGSRRQSRNDIQVKKNRHDNAGGGFTFDRSSFPPLKTQQGDNDYRYSRDRDDRERSPDRNYDNRYGKRHSNANMYNDNHVKDVDSGAERYNNNNNNSMGDAYRNNSTGDGYRNNLIGDGYRNNSIGDEYRNSSIGDGYRNRSRGYKGNKGSSRYDNSRPSTGNNMPY